MKLKKVNDATYVNVGIGNVTSVCESGPLTLINFVGGGQIEVRQAIAPIVAKLQDDGGFGR